MSNGNVNVFERLWKLWAMACKLVLDGKRAPEVLCDLLQKFIDTVTFTPAGFIGKGWSFAEPRNERSAALSLLDDYSKVKLSMDWLEGQALDGETRRTRILAATTHTPLNADHFFDLLTNEEKIPESWKQVKRVVTFDGDVLQDSHGSRYVLCLYWNDGRWHWGYVWLGSGWGADDPSAVLAS